MTKNSNINDSKQGVALDLLTRQAGFATISEAANYLRVSERQVRRFIGRGFFKPCKAIRKVLIPWKQLENFVQNTL